jgi:hypothetical protein
MEQYCFQLWAKQAISMEQYCVQLLTQDIRKEKYCVQLLVKISAWDDTVIGCEQTRYQHWTILCSVVGTIKYQYKLEASIGCGSSGTVLEY